LRDEPDIWIKQRFKAETLDASLARYLKAESTLTELDGISE